MEAEFYGRCDTCAEKVVNRYHTFSRQIAQCVYHTGDNGSQQLAELRVVYSEEVTRYCGQDCADVGAYCQLQDRGIALDVVDEGPSARCNKCRTPFDRRHAHISYEVMDQTEVRQPWLLSCEPHGSETVAVVCSTCDANVNFEPMFADEDESSPALIDSALAVH